MPLLSLNAKRILRTAYILHAKRTRNQTEQTFIGRVRVRVRGTVYRKIATNSVSVENMQHLYCLQLQEQASIAKPIVANFVVRNA